jgi:hypothetical protein
MDEELARELAAYQGGEGLSPLDLLGLPDGLRRMISWLTRRGGASLAELAAQLGCDERVAAGIADQMIARGLLTCDAALLYRTRLTGRRPRAREGQ